MQALRACTEKVFYMDLSDVTDRDGLQRLLRETLPLPEYYGGSLDALYDVLTEHGSGWNIILYRYAGLERLQPKIFAGLKRVFQDAVLEVPGLRVRFFKG
ncbi:MAG: barstar family protein [Lachnospiraceae bacterium]|nr:barstar family protein [Lachnospiraceae bacterium]